eukprot:1866890-Pleurochrysis_carterae.AAC.1
MHALTHGHLVLERQKVGLRGSEKPREMHVKMHHVLDFNAKYHARPNALLFLLLRSMEAFVKLEYVECDEDGDNSQKPLCRAEGVRGYPTWQLDGKLFPGDHPPQTSLVQCNSASTA